MSPRRSSGKGNPMIFEYAITVRSQQGRNSDYGRALERAAFFPGVTHAQVLARDAGSVTIGYNGRRPPAAQRDFCAELNAEGLIADVALWDPGSDMSRARYSRSLRSDALAPVANPKRRESSGGGFLVNALH